MLGINTIELIVFLRVMFDENPFHSLKCLLCIVMQFWRNDKPTLNVVRNYGLQRIDGLQRNDADVAEFF